MNIRLRLTLLLAGAALLVLVYTYPLWRPLLPEEQIVEVFPGLREDYQDEYAQLTPEIQELFSDIRETDPAIAIGLAEAVFGTPRSVPTEYQVAPTLQAEVLVAQGSFIEINAIQWARGSLTIHEGANRYLLLRLTDFQSARAPNLRLVLWSSRLPTDADGALNRFDLIDPIPLRGADVDLGMLHGDEGNQYYVLPPEIALPDYHSVVIYSQPYQLVFSVARLRLLR